MSIKVHSIREFKAQMHQTEEHLRNLYIEEMEVETAAQLKIAEFAVSHIRRNPYPALVTLICHAQSNCAGCPLHHSNFTANEYMSCKVLSDKYPEATERIIDQYLEEEGLEL